MKFTKLEIASIGISLALAVLLFSQIQIFGRKVPAAIIAQDDFYSIVLPPAGVEIPVKWGDLGVKLANAGVIDRDQFESVYLKRGGLTEEEKQILYGFAYRQAGANNGNIKITPENSGFWLNMFWALGLGSKNKILENGPMSDPQYGGAGYFASTGGWTLANGNAMEHYSKHSFVLLTLEQQKLVEEVSKNIYRPCCGNSTYFPDCNHGMAMLGLLELLAAQGVSEKEMYKTALIVNSYWFPDTYLTIARYFKEKKNINWGDADPKEILGASYSSASGYQNILNQITPLDNARGQGCGI